MSHHTKQSYFFAQRKRVLVRRVKKQLDTVSFIGEKREPILSFRPKAIREGEDGRSRPHPKRPASAVSRHSVVQFPPIDVTGPHLTTGTSTTQDRKRRYSQAVLERRVEEEEEEEEATRPNQPRYKFNEIKIASTGILSNLTQRLKSIPEEVNVPVTIAQILTFTFHQLVIDTIVDKREWQTDCYLDYKPKKEKKESIKTVKIDSKMSELERPLTAKSTASAVSIKSDISHGSSHDAAAEYDKLPPEVRGALQGPQILRYRRETQAPSRKILGPKTRLEKFQSRKEKAEKEKELRKKKSRANLGLRALEINNEEKDQEIPVIQASLIKFSLGSKLCADQGWIVHPSRSKDPEGYTLNQWASARLKEAMRQREEAKLTATLRGEDGPLQVCYYSDSHTRSIRGGGTRHPRVSSLPLPSVLSKLPPSLLSTASDNREASLLFPPSSDAPLCLLQLPDGSGLVNYYSGNIAVSMSRKGDGSRGLYVIVFDNNESHNVLAYFMPNGCTACYHRNGSIHMLTDGKGGKLLDEDGYTIREWEWPVLPQRMSQSILIQLNTHVALQCTGRTQMILKFSCHGQMFRFPVGLIPETLDQETRNESFWMKTTDVISDTLQTDLNFQSQAAKSASSSELIPTPLPPTSKPQSRGVATRESKRSLGGASKKGEELMESHSQLDWDKTGKLEEYRTKASSIVNDWLGHYRQLLGITARNNSCGLQSLTGSTHQLWASLNIRSSPGSRPQTNLSTRRAFQRLSSLQSSSTMMAMMPPPASPLPFHVLESRTGSPLPPEVLQQSIMSQISPLNELIIERPKSQDQPRPFKAGRAKPRPHPPHKLGCPVALHEVLVRKLTEMPLCKCDRRRLPLIRDIEFDIFMKSHISGGQLVVVAVTHSKSSSSLPLLEDINYSYNRNRSSPCQQQVCVTYHTYSQQPVHVLFSLGRRSAIFETTNSAFVSFMSGVSGWSSSDMFRIFKYDLTKCGDDLNTISGQGLLAMRHEVKEGMFLIFMGNQLLGCYTGFNGYGTAKRDFMKQVRHSMEAGRRGQFLPIDFKFKDISVGNKEHSQSLWAYPVSGVFDELVTPSCHSSSSPSRLSLHKESQSNPVT